MKHLLSVVAIIGRPNVGKSALFNRLIQRRQALVDAAPGITRDRLYGDVDWQGSSFRVVDTGGLQFAKGNRLVLSMEAQVAKAMEEASLALFVCDVREGPMPLDMEVTSWARRWGKPILLVVNKVDTEREMNSVPEFFQLGLGDPIPISSLHGLRIGELLDAVVEKLKSVSSVQCPVSASKAGHIEAGRGTQPLRVAIVGRPNVGKSSFVNRILNEERVLVDDTPGTTRDPVDTLITVEDRPYCLIDTAGIRAARRLTSRIDAIARLKALEVIARSDVCLGLLDATQGLIQDDLKLFDRVVTMGKPVCLAVNKWDLMPKSSKPEQVASAIARRAPFLRFFPAVCTSAKSGYHVLEALKEAGELALRATRRMPAAEGEQLLEVIRNSPNAPAGVRGVRFLQVSQVEAAPPTFHLMVRMLKPLKASDMAYLEGIFRRELKLEGIPIRVHLLRKRR